MKKLLLCSVLLISVSAAQSCGRSFSDGEITSVGFEGNWIVSKRDYLSGIEGKYIRTYTPNSCEAKSTIIFTKENVITHKFDMHGGNTCIDEGSDTAIYR